MNKINSRKHPEWLKSDIKLSIGVLVSNNIDTIRKCMDSLKPILDSVNSELIIVDTVEEGQSDGSLAVAEEYADKVYHFSWCNDFAAARNVCIDHAEGEWFLYVDDDEWFDDVQELIHFFLSGECERYAQGVYNIRNYDAEGSYTLAMVSRLFRRTKDTRFAGKVHEELTNVYLPKKMFSFCANHSGYAFKNEEERLNKQNRNVSLLEAEIKECGLDSARAAQMVQELLSRTATAKKGYELCMQYIAELEPTGQLDRSSGQWLLVASARYFSLTEQQDGLFRQAAWLYERFSLSQMAEIALAVTVVFPAVLKDRADLVAEYSAKYFAAWDWQKEHPQEALLQLQLDFPAFLTEEYYQKMIYIAAVTANNNHNYPLANAYLKRLPWNEESFERARYAEVLKQTLDGLKKMQKWNQAEELVNMLVQAQEILEVRLRKQVAESAIATSTVPDALSESRELMQCMLEAAQAIRNLTRELSGEEAELSRVLEVLGRQVQECVQGTDTAELTGRVMGWKRLCGEIAEEFGKSKEGSN